MDEEGIFSEPVKTIKRSFSMKEKIQFLIVEFLRGWLFFLLFSLTLFSSGISRLNLMLFTFLKRFLGEMEKE
jgi:hypothetical protein